MTDVETIVRMGQLAVSSDPDVVLTSLGLGSCIGLALIDQVARVAGLAHIMLPESRPGVDEPARFADTAVPLLLEGVLAAGARRLRLQAILVGGAQMFALSGGRSGSLDVGLRNEEATRAALREERLEVVQSVTGGSVGRTVRVHVARAAVSVKEAGGKEVAIWGTSS